MLLWRLLLSILFLNCIECMYVYIYKYIYIYKGNSQSFLMYILEIKIQILKSTDCLKILKVQMLYQCKLHRENIWKDDKFFYFLKYVFTSNICIYVYICMFIYIYIYIFIYIYDMIYIHKYR